MPGLSHRRYEVLFVSGTAEPLWCIAHSTSGCASGDEIPRVDTLLLDACIDDRARYSLLVLRELFQFCLPTNVAPLT